MSYKYIKKRSRREPMTYGVPKMHFCPAGDNTTPICGKHAIPRMGINTEAHWTATLEYKPEWVCKRCIKRWEKWGRSLDSDAAGMFILQQQQKSEDG